MDRQQRQQGSRGIATRGGGAGSGKGGGGGGKGGGGRAAAAAAGKKPIKVVYISNPMRVKTSAAGFRALVQELTGRNADPSKYSPRGAEDGAEPRADPGGAAAREEAGVDAAAASWSSSPDTAAALVEAGHPAAATFDEGDGDGVDVGDGGGYGYDGNDDDDDDDVFRSQLLDSTYSVFSPPTLLYDNPHSKV
ncbi:serine, glycine, tyrosine and glutamine-rich protein-like [Oryza brachyantha]|uniref:serine, glycine, tyrosine and glutamine-rich protein-like n=1 Tax=Oryza brachyantha TaxID=4533 RepID=UPI001ADC78CF|nr:serine, glycine, tyrosine and glutamine-rich protein-like [Oryza brachyantha]